MANAQPFTDTPIVQGIKLIATGSLSDRIKSVFQYPLLNAIQSKCFWTAYKSDDNLVLLAPTASGKTVVLELAICRLILQRPSHTFKIIYVAPTKALCSERQRDWQRKFTHLNVHCIELTGDSEHQGQALAFKNAEIIITTPEKLDSITRTWTDHKKVIEQVKLLLIDEVHLLREDRGATLEAVVSRMKVLSSGIRFVALSATIPNPEDIASWLGKNPDTPGMPAVLETFDDSFRPVELEKHVYGYHSNNSNDYVFERTLDNLLPQIIIKHSKQKPLLVFCSTRKSSATTASILADWWSRGKKYWNEGPKQTKLDDRDLQKLLPSGIAFHHGGLSAADRAQVEKGFVSGQISVICCTSTLATGINLPCHMVIIKNTTHWNNSTAGLTEYSELDIIQMLGRAGRPQFGNAAVAIIMTRQEKQTTYEKLVSGKRNLESKLHMNLIEHINAEISTGVIQDSESAKRWLDGTFFAIRFPKNRSHYQLSMPTSDICEDNISLLQNHALVTTVSGMLKVTSLGAAMARYFIRFETMKLFLQLPSRPRVSEILSALAQATELKVIRFSAGEKSLMKVINESPLIKYPIKVNLSLVAQKVSLMVQALLGGVNAKNEEQFRPKRQQYNCDESFILEHMPRLVKVIVECQLYLEDSVGTKNALIVQRSLSSKCWEDSPLQMAQLAGIGPVAVRKLVDGGISSLADLASADGQKIDMILSRNPPFGAKLLRKLADFPKLRVTVRMTKPVIPAGEKPGMLVRLRAEVGFMNDQQPASFQHKQVHVCFLAETSDDRIVHFSRISGQRIGKGEEIEFNARITSPNQLVTCYVACENFVGTTERATLDPKLDPQHFVNQATRKGSTKNIPSSWVATPIVNTSSSSFPVDLLNDRVDIDKSDRSSPNKAAIKLTNLKRLDDSDERSCNEFEADKVPLLAVTTAHSTSSTTGKLPNGKWECSHKCKNKNQCRHYCCNEGMDKPPVPSKKRKSDHQIQIGNNSTMTRFLREVDSISNTGSNHITNSNTATNLSAGEEPHGSEQRRTDHDNRDWDSNNLFLAKRRKKRGQPLLLPSSPSSSIDSSVGEIDLTKPSKRYQEENERAKAETCSIHQFAAPRFLKPPVHNNIRSSPVIESDNQKANTRAACDHLDDIALDEDLADVDFDSIFDASARIESHDCTSAHQSPTTKDGEAVCDDMNIPEEHRSQTGSTTVTKLNSGATQPHTLAPSKSKPDLEPWILEMFGGVVEFV